MGEPPTDARPWRERLADEMEKMGEMIEDLGVDLCSDQAFVEHCIRQLQTFDLLSQQQRYIAEILRSNDVEQAIAACPIAALGSRLSA